MGERSLIYGSLVAACCNREGASELETVLHGPGNSHVNYYGLMAGLPLMSRDGNHPPKMVIWCWFPFKPRRHQIAATLVKHDIALNRHVVTHAHTRGSGCLRLCVSATSTETLH